MDRKIVCAAVKIEDFVFPCVRHWDRPMVKIVAAIFTREKMKEAISEGREVQGFVDNLGNFYTQEEAMQFCIDHKQPLIHNPSYPKKDMLYSEDLY